MSVSKMPFVGGDADDTDGAGEDGEEVNPLTSSPPRRLSGDHWWDPDREAHVRDKPKYCPSCGHRVGEDETSLAVEYWEGDRRIYRVWCRSCDWTGDVVNVERVEGHEPAH